MAKRKRAGLPPDEIEAVMSITPPCQVALNAIAFSATWHGGVMDMTASISSGGRPARFLFAMFQGGGNIPLILPIAAQLVARGHEVRVLAGPGIRAGRLPVSARFRERIAAIGATSIPLQV